METSNLPYNRETKHRWRKTLKDFIKGNLDNFQDKSVLCLPGAFGMEVKEIYDTLGIKRKNITCFEYDRESYESLERSLPQTKNVLGDVISYLSSPEEPYDIVSLDLLGHVTTKFLNYLDNGKSKLFKPKSVFCVNFFAGRESTTATALIVPVILNIMRMRVCRRFMHYDTKLNLRGLLTERLDSHNKTRDIKSRLSTDQLSQWSTSELNQNELRQYLRAQLTRIATDTQTMLRYRHWVGNLLNDTLLGTIKLKANFTSKLSTLLGDNLWSGVFLDNDKENEFESLWNELNDQLREHTKLIMNRPQEYWDIVKSEEWFYISRDPKTGHETKMRSTFSYLSRMDLSLRSIPYDYRLQYIEDSFWRYSIVIPREILAPKIDGGFVTNLIRQGKLKAEVYNDKS